MPAKKNLSEMLTIPQAARILKVTRQGMWDAVKRGRLKATRFHHLNLISRPDLERYRKSRKRTGRPRKEIK